MRIAQVTDRINTDRIKEAPAQALRAVFAGIGQLLVVADRIRKQGNDRAEAGQRADGTDRGTAGQGASAQASPAQASPAQASPVKARRSLDQTGNVRLLSADDLADDLPVPPATPPPASPPPATTTLADSTADATPADVAPPDLAPADLAPADLASVDADPADADPAGTLLTGTTPADATPARIHPADADPAGTGPADADPAGTDDAANSVSEAALPVPNYDSLTLPSLRARLRTLDAHQLRVLTEYERSHAARADVVAMFERRIAKLAAEE
jgi:hypothetical protein